MPHEFIEEWFAHLLNTPILREIPLMSTWTPTLVMGTILMASWIIYAWYTYLYFREFKVTNRTTIVPDELVDVIDQPTYAKSRLYQLDGAKFGFVRLLRRQLEETAVVISGTIPYLWSLSGRVANYFGFGSEYEIIQSILFEFIASVIKFLLYLPFKLYATFVIEERHGFNKQTPYFFFKDQLKKFIVDQAITLPILSIIIHIVKIGGNYFFILLMLFSVLQKLAVMTVYADYIAPLFDKFTPLPEGELKTRIESLAKSVDFPLQKIFVIEGSKRSTHSNAYLYGFWKNKRIVLFDTLFEDYSHLIEEKAEKETEDEDEKEKKENKYEIHRETGCNNDEIIALLAHELGHWKLKHDLKIRAIEQISSFFCIAVFALLYRSTVLYSAFGFFSEKPIVIGLMVIYEFVLLPYKVVISFITTVLSRRFEFQADAFAKELHKAADLRSSLIKMSTGNLGFPVHDWLYSAWHHSHPPLLQRIEALQKTD